jgi:hypothetical protein
MAKLTPDDFVPVDEFLVDWHAKPPSQFSQLAQILEDRAEELAKEVRGKDPSEAILNAAGAMALFELAKALRELDE